MNKFNNSLFYLNSFLKYGISPRGVHWRDYFNQIVRFEALISQIDNLSKQTIVDAGCGFGDMYLYLKKIDNLPKKYIGIEKEVFFYTISKYRTKQQILKKDILKDKLVYADFYIASGSLNLLQVDEVELFIKKCFNYSNKGFLFNFLSKNQFVPIKKEEILDICGKITNNIKIVDNYLDNDYTIIMEKI